MKAIAIIPARFGSSRLEGKPLVDILGKPMIQRVYEQTVKAIPTVFVATDDERIKQVVIEFGGNVIMTSADHENGTTRCLEAYESITEKLDEQYDVIVNVQGDEPMLEPDQLSELLKPFENNDVRFSTLVSPVKSVQDLFNESEVFVVFDRKNRAMYFSRSVIPHIRGVHQTHWLEHHTYFKHVGLYAYNYSALKEFANLPSSKLERVESLEQNRWIENGNDIYVELTYHDTIPVDTIDDLKKVRLLLKEQQ
jgi:3-deoxy-manno-octulosonate cytidylyltransferase (CMP-KDO synthetase)|tara:strand:- start:2555 stop:3310 length:756 start_codon:yes stop_codon:yes gene_type:complete